MSEIVEIVDTLENRLHKLFEKMKGLEAMSENLKQQLKEATATIDQQIIEIDSLKKQHNAIKLANSLLGSEDNKRDTKLKINSLIRDIDYCISQLSD
jgi:chromosome segregation ATPase